MRALFLLKTALALTIAVGAVHCGKRGGGMPIEDCGPVEEARLEGVDAASLEGDYQLTLVATSGSAAGSTTSGRLSLRPNPPEMRAVPSAAGGARTDASAPLYGWTDVPLEPVGGVRVGDPASRDVDAPGVLVVTGNDRITLRFGSEANRRDVLPFDGAYTALRVQRVGAKGFLGTWASGVRDTDAEGYFCALRKG